MVYTKGQYSIDADWDSKTQYIKANEYYEGSWIATLYFKTKKELREYVNQLFTNPELMDYTGGNPNQAPV